MFNHSEMNADGDLCRLAKLAEFTFDVVQRQQNIGWVSIVDKTLLNELFSNFAKMAKKKNQVLNKLTTPSVNCSGRISITMTSEDTYDADMQKMMAKVQESQKLGQRNQETTHHVQTFSEDKDASEKTPEKERKSVSETTFDSQRSCDTSSTTEPPMSTRTAESTPTVTPPEIELETKIQSNDIAGKPMQVKTPLPSPKLIPISPKSTEDNVNLDAGSSTPKSVQTSATTAESTERTLPLDKSQNKQLPSTINQENSAMSPGLNTKIVWPLQNGIVKDELSTDAEQERTDRKLTNENVVPFHASRSELTLPVNSYSDRSTPMENCEHFSYIGRSRSEDSYAEHGSSYMKSLSCQSEMSEYMPDVKQFKHDDDDKKDDKRRDDDSSSGNDNQENGSGRGPNSEPEGAGDRTVSKSTQTDDEQNNGKNQSGGNKARSLQNSNQKMANCGDNFFVDEHNFELRVVFKPTPRKPSSSKGVNTSPSSSPLSGSIQPKIDVPSGENRAILSNVDSAFTLIKKPKRIKTCFLSKRSSSASSKKVVSFVECKE